MTDAREPTPRPLQILQVAWGFEAFGGMEVHVTELVLTLRACGHSVQLLLEVPASVHNAYIARLRRAGVPVSGAGIVAGLLDRLGQLPLGRARQAITAPIRSRHAHPVTRDLFRRLAAVVTASRPDVIHVHGTQLRQAWVIEWAHAHGIATVYTEHTTLDERDGAVHAAAVATMQTQLDQMVCVSARSRASLHATIGSDHRIAVMRHVVPGPAAERKKSRTNGDRSAPLRAICVARLESHKGIDVLLHALALARAQGVCVQLCLLGDGAERGTLQALARSLAVPDVQFVGAVPPEQVGSMLLEHELLILPSRGEGLPLTIVEAMAHGRAVLATRVGGNAEVVDDGVTGLLVAPERPEELAAAIVRLSNDRTELRRMGEAARRAWEAGEWAPDAVASHAVQLYRAAALHRAAR